MRGGTSSDIPPMLLVHARGEASFLRRKADCAALVLSGRELRGLRLGRLRGLPVGFCGSHGS